ncbi:MAG: OmpH family outer membrane protein [Acidobacteria bacterium]|nr:OmpH family outer membrane protein [Acidobacteriota bacterium]
MNSNIMRVFLVTAIALPMATLAQTGSAAAATTPAPSASTASTAPVAGPTKIGVISIQDAILATNEGQKQFDTLSKKFEPKRTEIKSLTDEIDSLKKQLDAQGTKLNEESRGTLVRQIESKQKTLNRTQEDAQNDFVGQQNEIAQKILQKMGPVIDKYAKDNGLTLIIDVSKPWPDGPVLWAGQSVDITRPIVELYNNQAGVPAAPSASRNTTGTTRASSPATRPATSKPSNSEPPK